MTTVRAASSATQSVASAAAVVVRREAFPLREEAVREVVLQEVLLRVTRAVVAVAPAVMTTTTITHRAAVAEGEEDKFVFNPPCPLKRGTGLTLSGSPSPLLRGCPKGGGVKDPSKMAKLKSWIRAARPRTLLLSFSGVLLGAFLAIFEVPEPVEGPTPWLVILFCALTAVLLQILSNLANDYGDFKKGTDGTNRVGPQREMQSGAITEKEMKRGLLVTVLLCLFSGGLLLLATFIARRRMTDVYVFAALGVAAILAALFYTLGKHPYGYRGLGDLFCFLFFGWAAVAGTYYLSAPWFDSSVLLPASAMGFLSNAVLNINNMRDYENDKASGKNSLVVKLGLKNAFVYHCLLIVGAFVSLTIYLILHHAAWYSYLYWLLFPLFLKDLIAIKKSKPEMLDPFLGRQVIHSFLLVVVLGVLFII